MNKKFRKLILVPTDFSDACDNAVKYAAQVAKSLNYKLSIIHILNKDIKAQLKRENENVNYLYKRLQFQVEEVKKRYEIEISYSVKEGSIFDKIHQEAENQGANLIVLGSHGKKGMQYLIGSHALRIIAKSLVPAIVVQNKPFHGFNNIVFPITDFTEARQKVKWAVFITRIFNSRIHLFIQNQNDPGLARKIEVITEQVKKAFDEEGIIYKLSKAGKKRSLHTQLINYAIENDADMIMIMTEPDIYAPDFNLGLWDERIMFNKAEIPVMCINPVELNGINY